MRIGNGATGQHQADVVGEAMLALEKLREEIFQHGYNEQRGTFTQAYDNDEVDASLLVLPDTGFLTADDPRMLATVARIEKELVDAHGLVLRYRTEAGIDGLEGDEYPFLICSFWLVAQYARTGRVAEADALFHQLASYGGELGLLAEEYDPTTGQLAGHYPQAFSHLGLIQAAQALRNAGATCTNTFLSANLTSVESS